MKKAIYSLGLMLTLSFVVSAQSVVRMSDLWRIYDEKDIPIYDLKQVYGGNPKETWNKAHYLVERSQTELNDTSLWLFTEIYINDTVCADSMVAAYAAQIYEEDEARLEQTVRAPFRDSIAELDRLMGQLMEYEINGKKIKDDSVYSKLAQYENHQNITDKERKTILKRKVPEGFTEKILMPKKERFLKIISAAVPVQKYFSYRDVFTDWPKKKIIIRYPNPLCIDNYFNGTFPLSKYPISSEDQQSKGWEWANIDSMTSATDYFVETLEYLYHPSYPQYRFIRDYQGNYDYIVYNDKGALVRIGNITSLEDYPVSDISDFEDYAVSDLSDLDLPDIEVATEASTFSDLSDRILLEICKRDFLANKYNIKTASKNDIMAVKLILGITDNIDANYNRYKKKADDANAELMKAYAEKNYGKYRKAKSMASDAALKLWSYEFKKMNEVARGYVDRLYAEHKNDLSHLYKIERVNNTTFNFYFLNDKMECGCVAQIIWHNKKPYEAMYEVKLLPCKPIKFRKLDKGDMDVDINATTPTASNQWAESKTINLEVKNGVSRREEKSTKYGYSLGGRKAISLPKPNYTGNQEGKIVAKIWVNRSGDVIRVECPATGSTINNGELINAAKEAAHKARFNADGNAPEEQIGTITFVFKRN